MRIARRVAAACYRADFGGEATVIIGDTPFDVAAALACGARAVAVATGQFTAAALAEAGPHVLLTDLCDTGACWPRSSAAWPPEARYSEAYRVRSKSWYSVSASGVANGRKLL